MNLALKTPPRNSSFNSNIFYFYFAVKFPKAENFQKLKLPKVKNTAIEKSIKFSVTVR